MHTIFDGSPKFRAGDHLSNQFNAYEHNIDNELIQRNVGQYCTGFASPISRCYNNSFNFNVHIDVTVIVSLATVEL